MMLRIVRKNFQRAEEYVMEQENLQEAMYLNILIKLMIQSEQYRNILINNIDLYR